MKNLFYTVSRRIKLQGMLVGDHADLAQEFTQNMAQYIKEGKVKVGCPLRDQCCVWLMFLSAKAQGEARHAAGRPQQWHRNTCRTRNSTGKGKGTVGGGWGVVWCCGLGCLDIMWPCLATSGWIGVHKVLCLFVVVHVHMPHADMVVGAGPTSMV